jgi:hypothetical protein
VKVESLIEGKHQIIEIVSKQFLLLLVNLGLIHVGRIPNLPALINTQGQEVLLMKHGDLAWVLEKQPDDGCVVLQALELPVQVEGFLGIGLDDLHPTYHSPVELIELEPGIAGVENFLIEF